MEEADFVRAEEDALRTTLLTSGAGVSGAEPQGGGDESELEPAYPSLGHRWRDFDKKVMEYRLGNALTPEGLPVEVDESDTA